MAYRDLKRAQESQASFRHAIQASEGRFSPAQFALASLLSDEKKFAEAEAAARKGLQGENTSAPGHYELARSLLGQGKASEAEAEARATLTMSRELPQAYLLLAAVYEGRNQMQQAVKELDRYLLAVPKGPVSDSVRAVRQDLQRRLLASK
jgi:tetratricopeptide (TPR) repeat protein